MSKPKKTPGPRATGAGRRAPRVFHEPVVYEVGKDLPQDQYETLLVTLADWLAVSQQTKEPGALARHLVRCCLEGKTTKGQPWYSAWNVSLSGRLRMLARFDLDAMQGITTASEDTQRRKAQRQRREAKDRNAIDANIPPLTQRELKRTKAAYGDSPHALLTDGELKLWRKMRDGYLDKFPELRSINAEAELALLCDLHVIFERNRLRLLKGEKVDPVAMQENTQNIVNLKKALGIHPDQLARRVQEEKEGTIGEVVQRLERVPADVRERWWLEQLLMFAQMYVSPSPRADMGGYQINREGLFAATKCRTCHCWKCGEHNYDGYSFDQVRDALVARGLWTYEGQGDPLPAPHDTAGGNHRVLPVLPEAEGTGEEDGDDSR